MTIYAGEELRVTSTVSGFEGEPLTNLNVVSVTITIYGTASTVPIVNAAPMTYDTGVWFYMWDTTGLTSGTYKAKVVVTDLQSHHSWEWRRIRLARDLVA